MSQLRERLFKTRPQLPYVLPIIIFGAFLLGESEFPQIKWLLYPLKAVAVGLCFWWLREEFKGLSWKWSWWAIVIGVVVAVQWIGMEEFFETYWHYPPLPVMGGDAWDTENVFNPVKEFGGRGLSFWLWIAFRMGGAVIVVPIMEELFWRGFLLRLFVGRYFERVQLGEFSWFSCLAVAGLFATVHSWYISAFVCALFYNWLLYRTKSILACLVAHGLTNLLLWIYILRFDAWWLS